MVEKKVFVTDERREMEELRCDDWVGSVDGFETSHVREWESVPWYSFCLTEEDGSVEAGEGSDCEAKRQG